MLRCLSGVRKWLGIRVVSAWESTERAIRQRTSMSNNGDPTDRIEFINAELGGTRAVHMGGQKLGRGRSQRAIGEKSWAARSVSPGKMHRPSRGSAGYPALV